MTPIMQDHVTQLKQEFQNQILLGVLSLSSLY